MYKVCKSCFKIDHSCNKFEWRVFSLTSFSAWILLQFDIAFNTAVFQRHRSDVFLSSDVFERLREAEEAGPFLISLMSNPINYNFYSTLFLL